MLLLITSVSADTPTNTHIYTQIHTCPKQNQYLKAVACQLVAGEAYLKTLWYQKHHCGNYNYKFDVLHNIILYIWYTAKLLCLLHRSSGNAPDYVDPVFYYFILHYYSSHGNNAYYHHLIKVSQTRFIRASIKAFSMNRSNHHPLQSASKFTEKTLK